MGNLVGAFVVPNNPQNFNYQLRQAVLELAFRGGEMTCVAVRDDSVAPYGGYGFRYADTTPDFGTAFSFGVQSGGGTFLPGGFQQGFISQPGVIATINVVRTSFAATLFGYFIEQNPSHPQADRDGKPYCMKFGGSMSQRFAIWNVADNYTPQTAPDHATISFTVADANLSLGFGSASYPALYKSSAPITAFPGAGASADRRMFPSPYLCMPHNSFSASAALIMNPYQRTFRNDELTTPGRIDLQFAGDGIPSGSMLPYAVGP